MASIPSACEERKKEKISSGINGLILLLIVKFCGVLKQEKPGLKRRPIPKTVFSWAKYYIPPYGFLTPDKVTEPSSTPTHMTLRRGRVEVRRKKTYKKKFLKRVVRKIYFSVLKQSYGEKKAY